MSVPHVATLWIIRAVFFASSVGTAVYAANAIGAEEHALAYISVGMGVALLAVLGEMLSSKSSIQMVSAVVFGTLVGLLAAWLFTGIIQVVAQGVRGDLRPVELDAIRLALTLVFVYFGITWIIRTKDDFRFIVPYVEFRREVRGERPFVLDTSALIDGRFNALAESRLIDARVIVPRFVVAELQALADSQDKTKRARGRRGLDKLTALREREAMVIEVAEVERGETPVDAALVRVAVERGARLVTTDQALLKLGELDHVETVSLHEIGKIFQLRVMSGDRIALELVKAGEEKGQAVGYLPDGAMVVVEDARDQVGQTIDVEVTSALKTRSGQMYFAKRVAEATSG